MSSKPAAPSRASATAWARTSASEWPRRPFSKGISTPPRTSLRRASGAAKAWNSIPRPTLKPVPARLTGGSFSTRRDKSKAQLRTPRCSPSRTPPRAASMASASTRSSGEVSLMFVSPPAPMATRPARRPCDALYELRRDEAAGAVVDQDERLFLLFAEEQAATGREGTGLAGLGAPRVFADARPLDELNDARPVADGVDPVDARGILEGSQSVVERGPAEKLYELLRPPHPAAYAPGEHERDRRAGTRYVEPFPPNAPSTSSSASSVETSLHMATSEMRILRAFASRFRSPVESPRSPP